jgi:predicted PurR-regulated permease PerM
MAWRPSTLFGVANLACLMIGGYAVGQAIRVVVLGVVLTALVHAVLGSIGLAVVGMPFTIFLTAVMFISAIVQVGVIPVFLYAIG